MLGWTVFVKVVSDKLPINDKQSTLSHWRCGIGEPEWLKPLVESGEIIDLGGNGYPNNYSTTLEVLIPYLNQDTINKDLIESVGLKDSLLIEMWDMS